MNRSFREVLDANKGIGPGFEILRIGLALLIFYGHAGFAAGVHVHSPETVARTGEFHHIAPDWTDWKRSIYICYVPAFFALSGFLVTGSALRTQVTSTFLAFRVLRLIPALLVEVLLSALLLGPLLTSLPLNSYVRDPSFFRYFGNIIGWITFELPGVFLKNPIHAVNLNLWTLPSELHCYILTSILMMSGILYRKNILTAIFVFVSLIFMFMNATLGFCETPTILDPIAITYYFFVGVMFFHWRSHIPTSTVAFVSSGIATFILMFFHNTVFFTPVFLAYCTIFVGLLPIPKLPIITRGDYSYGIYLYGFPITQAVVAIVPFARGNGRLTFILALFVTAIFAAFSWHFIERPALQLKNKLPPKLFPRGHITARTSVNAAS